MLVDLRDYKWVLIGVDTNSGLALGYMVVVADAHSISKTKTEDKALV